MEYLPIINEIIHFFYLTLPLLFFGFLCANTLKATSYLDLAGLPMRAIARAAHLPSSSAPALTLFFLSSWSGMGMLSHYLHEEKLEERSVLISVMIAQFPKSVHSVIFFQGPLVFSLLGQMVGGVLIASELGMNFIIASLGIIIGRKILPVPSYQKSASDEMIRQDPKKRSGTWIDTGTIIITGTFREFFQVAKVLIPTGVLFIVLLDLGISTVASSVLGPIMDYVHLPSFTVVVLASAFVSQIAVITSAGTLIAMDDVTVIQCLLILFIARAIHLGIGYLKTSLPTNISLFGPLFGPRVTGFECFLTESWIVLMILIVILFQ